MSAERSLPKIDANDPRIADIVDAHPKYRDVVGQLTEAEREFYKGKLLAISHVTGEIIAAADTDTELQAAVRESEFSGQDWSLIDGPNGEPRLSVEKLIKVQTGSL